MATAQTARAQAAAAAAAATTSAAAYTHAAPATSQAANAILARLEQPAALQPAELVPALRSAVVVACAGSRGAERAAPLLLGLAARAADVLASPPAAQGLGPEAPLLLLELLSQMAPQDEAAAAQRACLWRRAHCALGDAADVAGVFSLSNPHHMSPAQLLRYYEACARCPAAGSPSKSRGLGLLLRSHLHAGCAGAGAHACMAWPRAVLRGCQPPGTDNAPQLAANSALTCALLRARPPAGGSALRSAPACCRPGRPCAAACPSTRVGGAAGGSACSWGRGQRFMVAPTAVFACPACCSGCHSVAKPFQGPPLVC